MAWIGAGRLAAAVVAGLGLLGCESAGSRPQAQPEPSAMVTANPSAGVPPVVPPAEPSTTPPGPSTIPTWVDRPVFAGGRILVAYYGTAQTASMGVLGEAPPDQITQRLRESAKPFGRTGRRVQIVYELIVTIADPTAGEDGDFSHDIPRSAVQRYVRAARRHQAVLLLDLQPGHSTFPQVARRWAWALRQPHVGLALDPEWRMTSGGVPGQVIGWVSAAEINRTSAWLARLTRRHDLPEKALIVHQFRTDMVRDITGVKDRKRVALIQHADGFGSPSQKLQTYRTIEQHRRFHMGFKLFYDEDTDLLRPRDVLAIRPRVHYVSYQ